MPSQIKPTGGLTFSIDSANGSITAPTPSNLAFDFTAPAKYYDERQTLSTAFADLTLGDVGWTNVTWTILKNHSSTNGENQQVIIEPKFVAGGTDDGTVAGASLAATLTAAGYYKRITTNGTSHSKDWVKGDIAVYLGSSGVYLQLRPKGFTMKPGEIAGPFRVTADGTAWKICADAGTPQVGKLAVGACA